MNRDYQRLRESIPEPRQRAEGKFHADAKKVKEWVTALPRANANATQFELEKALSSLARQSLSGAQRLGVLEELRPTVVESIELLQQSYAGSALPLTASKSQAAQAAEDFHLLLAHGYRKAAVELCAPSGGVPMLRGGAVAQCLERAAHHFSRALAVAWRIYRAPGIGLWQGLHRVHRYATSVKLADKVVEDKYAGGPADVHSTYLQALLMAVCNPLAFSQSEQDMLWQVVRSFAQRCELVRKSPVDNAPVVPEDADRGPGPGAVDETHSQWLDMRAFVDAVEDAIARVRDGHADLVPPRGMGIRFPIEALLRLRRSFGLAAARSHKRLDASHELRTVIGMSCVHFYLAGERDFDTFMRQAAQHAPHAVDRASWAAGGTDAARVPVYVARVLDQSLGGYRVAWGNASQIRARVGELVGITLATEDEQPDWMIGVLRWLRYEADGGLSAGIELVSRQAAAIGLRVFDRGGAPRAASRALEIESVDLEGERCFLAPGVSDTEATRIEVIRDAYDYRAAELPDHEELIAGLDVLVNAGEYAVLRPLRQDLMVDAAEAHAVEAGA
jgi:hypothetical protein